MADILSLIVGGPFGSPALAILNKSFQIMNFQVRDSLNKGPTEDKPLSDKMSWKLLSKNKSAFHQPDNGRLVLKYTSVGSGVYEVCIYDDTGENVEDPMIKATFNYGSDGSDSWIGAFAHLVADIIPWIVYGADIDDPSTIFSRIEKTIDGAKGLNEPSSGDKADPNAKPPEARIGEINY